MKTTTTTDAANDRLAAFRTAAATALEAGEGPDLYDLSEVLRQADHFRAHVQEIADHPERYNVGAVSDSYDAAAYARTDCTGMLARLVRSMVERTCSNAVGDRDMLKAACAPPDFSETFRVQRAAEVRRYEDSVVCMDDDALVRHGQERAVEIRPAVYDEIAVLVAELRRRGMAEPAKTLEGALYAARVAYKTNPRYITAGDTLARAETWLREAGDDPVLVVDGAEVKVSELIA